jgi:cystathionine beta-lyase/cystathionine gamma-synthase
MGLIGRQMAGPGAVLALELVGGQQAVEAFVAALELATPAVSLGATDTLVQQPASLTHRVVDPEARRATGINDGLVRVSVGIEDPEDLWDDFSRALDRAMVAAQRLVEAGIG